jgi:hypothetical protein
VELLFGGGANAVAVGADGMEDGAGASTSAASVVAGAAIDGAWVVAVVVLQHALLLLVAMTAAMAARQQRRVVLGLVGVSASGTGDGEVDHGVNARAGASAGVLACQCCLGCRC